MHQDLDLDKNGVYGSYPQFSHLRNFIKIKLYHIEESRLENTFETTECASFVSFLSCKSWGVKILPHILPYTCCIRRLEFPGMFIDFLKQEPALLMKHLSCSFFYAY